MARRILLIILGLVIMVVAAAIVFGLLTARAPLPTTNGTLSAPGLQGPVTVYRDEWGVPQVYAENTHDLFLAQGYVTAQDRLWQMDFQRRVGMGRLSEVLGESTVETDRFLRTIGPHRAAQRDLALLSPETLAALEAYAQGVNAYIATGRLPLEFTILGYEPEPWQPLHSLVWGKMMAWSLGGNWETELMRAKLIDLLGAEAAADLLPTYPDEGPFVIPPEVQDYSSLRGLDYERAMTVRRLLKTDGDSVGSNNWVVSGERSATGMPLLANDPHLGMQMPSIWYEVGLHGGGVDAVGVSLPGVPGVTVGHNSHIAWGVTTVNSDIEDLFLERVNPENPNQYEFQGAWQDMEVIQEAIQVKGQDQPLVETVRITRHGPIMNDVVSDLPGETGPIALRWTAQDGDHLADALLEVNVAQDFDQFRAALSHWQIAAQNFVYADTGGNIGYQMTGDVPIRAAGDGMLPVPGWSGDYEWTGKIPFEEMPYSLNPDVGYVASANNKVVPDNYPYLIGTDWAAPYRAQRIVDLIESHDELSVDDFAAMQGDVHPIPADLFVPLLDGLSLDDADQAAQEALDLVTTWDRRMDADQAAPLIFQQFYLELARATVGDELEAAGGQDLVDSYLGDFSNEHHVMLQRLAAQPDNAWWDDVNSPQMETQTDIVQRAFLAAVDALQTAHGENPGKWRWGDVHWANFDHPLGAVSPLNLIFNKRIAARGSAFTIDAASLSYPDLVMDHGASFREIVDLGTLANSRIVNTTGQSGQAFDRHYGDMIELWQGVGYHPMLFERGDVEASAVDVLTLQPQ